LNRPILYSIIIIICFCWWCFLLVDDPLSCCESLFSLSSGPQDNIILCSFIRCLLKKVGLCCYLLARFFLRAARVPNPISLALLWFFFFIVNCICNLITIINMLAPPQVVISSLMPRGRSLAGYSSNELLEALEVRTWTTVEVILLHGMMEIVWRAPPHHS